MKQLKTLVVSLALAATSVHVGAAIETGDRGKRVPSGNVLAPGSVFAAEGSGAKATVTSGTQPAVFREGSNTHLPTKPRAADSGSASGFSAVGSAIEENVNSSDERRFSAATALSVPEPGKWAVALAGLLGVGAIARRRMSS